MTDKQYREYFSLEDKAWEYCTSGKPGEYAIGNSIFRHLAKVFRRATAKDRLVLEFGVGYGRPEPDRYW